MFVAVTIVVIARGVVRQGVVDQQSIVGAIGIYLLFGMLFTFAYAGSRRRGGAVLRPRHRRDRRPTAVLQLLDPLHGGVRRLHRGEQPRHTLAVSEALLGQLYLVTVVALLVSRVRPRGEVPPPS